MTEVYSQTARGNDHKLKQEFLARYKGKKKITNMIIKHEKRLP